MYRQGDVLLVPANKEELKSKLWFKKETLARDGKFVLAEGETSGHYHGVTVDACEYKPISFPTRSILEGTVVGTLDVKLETDLEHVGHHSPIPVAPGFYFVVQQREYDPATHSRPVFD